MAKGSAMKATYLAAAAKPIATPSVRARARVGAFRFSISRKAQSAEREHKKHLLEAARMHSHRREHGRSKCPQRAGRTSPGRPAGRWQKSQAPPATTAGARPSSTMACGFKAGKGVRRLGELEHEKRMIIVVGAVR